MTVIVPHSRPRSQGRALRRDTPGIRSPVRSDYRCQRKPGSLTIWGMSIGIPGSFPLANRLLNQVGLASGHRAIDIACGPLGILHLLYQRVGDAGHVMGLDVDPVMIECAQQVTIERRLHIELALGDASSTGLPRSSFALVHARLVLGNILAREEVV
jgi:SAM-dependent methyltransferase